MSSFVRLAVIPSLRTLAAAVLLSISSVSIAARSATAQVVETPVSFDSAGRLRTLTQALVTRVGLTAPTWPVTGEFVEARLFAVTGGGYVLAVDRSAGRVERYPLTEEQRTALRTSIDAGMAVSGRPVGEDRPAVISEPARGAFVRNQMLLAGLLYGPALSSLTNDAKAGTAVYLLTVGTSFFVLQEATKHANITRAQNTLATDGALRGALMAHGLVYTFGAYDDEDDDLAAVTTIAGALTGSITGFTVGRRLTDAEAHAAATGSSFTAIATAGVLGTVGAFKDNSDNRVPVGVLVGAAALGYPIGLAYARSAGYTITAGDITMMKLGAGLGVAAAAIPFASSDDPDPKVVSGALTAGFLAGALVGDLAFVRPYDHSSSEASQILLGTAAGGIMGAAVAVLAEPNETGWLGLITLGATVGTLAAQHIVEPRRAGAGSSGNRGGAGSNSGAGASRSASRVQFSPLSLGFAAAGVKGRHSLLSVTF